MATLPVISISPYVRKEKSTDQERLATAEALHKACRDFGFFYLDISSFVSDAEMETLIGLARQFFALPQERKDLLTIRNEDNVRGGKADNHEAIDLYTPVDKPDKTKPLWGTNQWPEDVPSFRSTYEAWTEKMKALGLLVMEAMAFGLGMTPEEREEFKACDALQVFVPKSLAAANQITKSGAVGLPKEEGDADGIWIYANPLPGCVVCNIGEMWEPNFDTLVKPLTAVMRAQDASGEKIDDGRYAPVVYGEFLKSKVTTNFSEATPGGDIH
ncbi:hypothetical protein FRC04_002115 [Tulasnella sp. 424]|nr:hypothetical protein FRC04_002115 [Tulasnella sp. 424]